MPWDPQVLVDKCQELNLEKFYTKFEECRKKLNQITAWDDFGDSVNEISEKTTEKAWDDFDDF